METEVSIALAVALSTLAGAGVGAFITYKIEQRRQKGELERQRLDWKREERQKNLEPIRRLLDELTEDLWKYVTNLGFLEMIPKYLKEQEARHVDTESIKKLEEQKELEMKKLQTDFELRILDYNIKAAVAIVKTGDNNLAELVVTQILRPIAEGSFDIMQLERPISDAYRRIEQLATEF